MDWHAQVPEGNTNFVFRAGDLHFQSLEYQGLVVTGGDTAKFRGTGTIEGDACIHKFMIWAKDSDVDEFRIKIWDELDGIEDIIYDNTNGTGTEPITGGNICIHKK